ncbi:MAG: T9SS type A sorting domain-containing protein [Cyclobacteriaceae bacterium]|nr:T9SS type A sorting domain-containing protein [Cyclobacteriaceae bacterium]
MRTKGLIIWIIGLFLLGTVYGQQPGINRSVSGSEAALYTSALDGVRIDLYPNPATDFIVIELKGTSINNPQIELRSIIGNNLKIELEHTGTNTYRISLKEFATGYYFLVVRDDLSRFKKAYKFLKN